MAFTNRGSTDQRINSVMVNQHEIARELMDAIGNAVSMQIHIMQQWMMNKTGQAHRFTKSIPFNRLCGNNMTLILSIGKMKYDIHYDNDTKEINTRSDNITALLTESGAFRLTIIDGYLTYSVS